MLHLALLACGTPTPPETPAATRETVVRLASSLVAAPPLGSSTLTAAPSPPVRFPTAASPGSSEPFNALVLPVEDVLGAPHGLWTPPWSGFAWNDVQGAVDGLEYVVLLRVVDAKGPADPNTTVPSSWVIWEAHTYRLPAGDPVGALTVTTGTRPDLPADAFAEPSERVRDALAVRMQVDLMKHLPAALGSPSLYGP
ncbi:MAG: hypothetical protein KC656_08055 [Myxococcales bacterium]|nr:hypothetical protein [Myxococcales bacterium]